MMAGRISSSLLQPPISNNMVFQNNPRRYRRTQSYQPRMPARNECNAGRRDVLGDPRPHRLDVGREGRPRVVASGRASQGTGRTVQRNFEETSFQAIAISNAVASERSTQSQDVGVLPTRHAHPYQPHFGDPREDIRGIVLVYIALYRAAFPEAMVADVIAILWDMYSRHLEPPLCYHPLQIERAELRYGITLTSMENTEAYEKHQRRLLRRRRRRRRR